MCVGRVREVQEIRTIPLIQIVWVAKSPFPSITQKFSCRGRICSHYLTDPHAGHLSRRKINRCPRRYLAGFPWLLASVVPHDQLGTLPFWSKTQLPNKERAGRGDSTSKPCTVIYPNKSQEHPPRVFNYNLCLLYDRVSFFPYLP